jgi:beta-lactamase regulating signal transducer with metallopeptidase domain
MTLAVLGWTIVHSTWQWTIVGGIAALLLGVLRHARPHARYIVCCGALTLMLLTSMATAWLTFIGSVEPMRARTLYAFDGRLIMQGVVANGATIMRASALLWLAGVAVGVVRLGADWRRVRRLRREQIISIGATDRATVSSLQRDLGLHRSVAVHQSALASVPMVIGWRRPQILLPVESTRVLTDSQRRAVLAHELGHVSRGDIFANAVQAIIDVSTFYHPAARWVSAHIRAEREYACDDIAVASTHDAISYARALAVLEDARCDRGLVVAAASGTLLDRIRRIAGEQPTSSPLRGGVLCAVACLIAVVIFAITLNVPSPGMPAGIRMRRPMPRPASQATIQSSGVSQTALPVESRSVTVCLADLT